MQDTLKHLIAWLDANLSLYAVACTYLLSVATMLLAATAVIFRRYLAFRAPTTVRCPIDGDSATVQIAPFRAALADFFGENDVSVGSCSRFTHGPPTCRQGCRVEIR